MTKKGATCLHGHQIELSDGRHVFYAAHNKVHYLRFRSAEGVETKLKLSGDAGDALIELLTQPSERYRWIVNVNDEPRDALTWTRLKDMETLYALG